MAIHTLGDNSFLDLKYDLELYRGVDINIPSTLVNNFYPSIKSITSKSENKIFRWLFGKVKIEGNGKVQVTYPYLEEHTKTFTLKNVDFSSVPYVTLKAVPEEGSKFKGWYCSVTKKLLTRSEVLMLSEDKYTDVTGFVAIFNSPHEDNLGI